MLTPAPSPSTYNLPNNSNFGTLTLATSAATYQFNILVSNTGNSSLIMTSPGYGSGLLEPQKTPFSLPNLPASYAFGLSGNDGASLYAAAGALTVNTALNITGQEDVNDGGTINGGGGLGSPLSITGGAISEPDQTTGRGTITLNVSGQSGAFHYVYYTTGVIAGANGLVAMETDSSGPMTLLSLLPQAAGGITGQFANNSLTCSGPGACVVVQLQGLSTSGPDAQIGVMTFDGNGNITRSGIDSLPGYFTDENNAGTASQNSYNGTYSVASNGRVTVTLTSAPYQPVWYLVTKNQGFVLGSDPSVTSGQFSPQTGAPYTIASLLGSYLGGTITPVSSNITNEIDVAGTPPPGGIWAMQLRNQRTGRAQTDRKFTGAYDYNTFGHHISRRGRHSEGLRSRRTASADLPRLCALHCRLGISRRHRQQDRLHQRQLRELLRRQCRYESETLGFRPLIANHVGSRYCGRYRLPVADLAIHRCRNWRRTHRIRLYSVISGVGRGRPPYSFVTAFIGRANGWE